MISQTPLKVVQYTQQTNVPALLLYGPSILVSGSLAQELFMFVWYWQCSGEF